MQCGMSFVFSTKGENMPAMLTESERDRAAQIIALFSILVHSWQTNEFAEAAHARAELEKHGIRVKFVRRSSGSWGVRDDG